MTDRGVDFLDPIQEINTLLERRRVPLREIVVGPFQDNIETH